VDPVVILPNDPLHPKEKAWVVHGGMATANGTDSFIAKDFPAGSANIPVQSGQLLGYQGSWSRTPFWTTQVHTYIVLVDANGRNAFPESITSAVMVDPAPIFGFDR